jgi:hypothetical protein
MYLLAALAYIGCLIAFVLIYLNESQKTFQETSILTYDATGQAGYTCQMISKATASFTVNTSVSLIPSLSYDLVNVMESNAQYQSDLAATMPCSFPLTYFPGSAAPLSVSGSHLGGAAFFKSEWAFVIDETSSSVLALNYTVGVMKNFPLGNQASGTVAASRAGEIVILVINGANWTLQTISPISGAVHSIMDVDVSINGPEVVNDNLNNIYMWIGLDFFAVDIYTPNPTPVLLFTLNIDDMFRSVAVYNDGSSPTVYFVNGTQHCQAWRDGVFRAIEFPTPITALAVDGAENVYVLTATQGKETHPRHMFILYVYCTDIHSFMKVLISSLFLAANFCMINLATPDGPCAAQLYSTTTPTGYAVTPGGERGIFVYTTVTSHAIGFMYDLHSPPNNAPSYEIQTVSDFGAAYFTCGAINLQGVNFTTSSAGLQAYAALCPMNGIVGEMTWTGTYAFTQPDAKTFSLQYAAGPCLDLYGPIGTTVGALPPYSCSRSVHQSFLACLATAVANTQLLFQIITFLAAALLTKLARRYPPMVVARPVHSGRGGGAHESAVQSPQFLEMAPMERAGADGSLGMHKNPMI